MSRPSSPPFNSTSERPNGTAAAGYSNDILSDPYRLATLHNYQILGTGPEPAFDDIACLASQICQTPMAFVIFVDDTRQFYKAAVGVGTKRGESVAAGFCAITVSTGQPLIIPDTKADPAHAQNPVVAAPKPIRFYAGIPVRSPDDHVLGTVAVADWAPRELTEAQLNALKVLARQVETLLCLRVSEAAVQERERRVRTLYEITARPDFDYSEKVSALLHACREWLHLDIGVLARTDCAARTYEVLQIDSTDRTVPIGFTCPLDQTFCSEAIKAGLDKPVIAVEHAGADEAWRKLPAYRLFGTEAYLAAVVRVRGDVWGTLSFVSNTPRRTSFSDFDLDIVRLLAQWVSSECERQGAEAALQATSRQQRRFVRDMLASVTEGKLCLCEGEIDLPPRLAPVSETIDLTPASMRGLRRSVMAAAESLGFSPERTQDLVTAVGEAGMNAIKHGGGTGRGTVCADRKKGVVQVWIQDHGKGIREEELPRATLEKGWSGAGSLGHGFYLMLRTVDRTFLLTGPSGTTVVVEQECEPPQPAWLTSLPPQ